MKWLKLLSILGRGLLKRTSPMGISSGFLGHYPNAEQQPLDGISISVIIAARIRSVTIAVATVTVPSARDPTRRSGSRIE